MKEKKLYIALESLTVYELNSFNKYLRSPFFNQNESITQYYEYLIKSIKSGNTLANLTKNEIWSAVYGDAEYVDVKLRKLDSDLYNHFEMFLAQREFQKDKQLANNLKLKAFKDKNVDALYPSLIREVEQTRKIDPNRHAEYFLNQFKIEKSIFDLKSEFEKKNVGKDIESEINVTIISENLDIFYIAEKLKYFCTLLTWRQMYKIEKSIKGIDIILKLAQNTLFQKVPIIAIYYRISKILSDSDSEPFYYELKSLANEHLHLFPEDEAQEILLSMLSYCINKVNTGQLEFQSETLDLYKRALTNDLLLIDGFLSPTTYRNIVFFALRTGEYNWAESFIYEYEVHVEEKYRINALNFNLARLEMYRNEYEKVISHLHKVSFDDVWYNINSRSLLLTAYYELGEFDALESLLQSFRIFITREKSLPKARKSNYLNLIKFSRKLLNLERHEKSKINDLKLEIQSTAGVVNKPWLLNKITELQAS